MAISFTLFREDFTAVKQDFRSQTASNLLTTLEVSEPSATKTLSDAEPFKFLTDKSAPEGPKSSVISPKLKETISAYTDTVHTTLKFRDSHA